MQLSPPLHGSLFPSTSRNNEDRVWGYGKSYVFLRLVELVASGDHVLLKTGAHFLSVFHLAGSVKFRLAAHSEMILLL